MPLLVPGGSSVLFAIFGITVLASAASIARMAPGAAQTKLAGISETRAYYMALSGLNVWSAGQTGTYTLAGGSFTLSQTGPDVQATTQSHPLAASIQARPSEANHTDQRAAQIHKASSRLKTISTISFSRKSAKRPTTPAPYWCLTAT